MLTFYYAKLLIQLHNVKKKSIWDNSQAMFTRAAKRGRKKKKNGKEFAEEDSQAVLRCSVGS